jgi:WD40 repeat protein
MDCPPREKLLDIDWLVDTRVRQGLDGLQRCVRAGAEAYGGAVTAIADAVMGRRYWTWTSHTDVRHALAMKLPAGSWSPALGGPRAYRRETPYCIFAPVGLEKLSLLAERHGHAILDAVLPDLPSLRLIEPFDCAWFGHTDGIWGCAVSPDGLQMVSGSRDHDIAVWDMHYGTCTARAHTGGPEVRDCAVTPDGRCVIAVQLDGRVTLWDVRTLTLLASFDGRPRKRWRAFAFSSDATRFAMLRPDGAIVVRRLDDFAHLTTLWTPSEVFALSFDASGATLRAALGDLGSPRQPSSIVTWDVASARKIDMSPLWAQQSDWLTTAAFTPDSRLFIGVGRDTILWSVGNPEPLARVPAGIFDGRALAISPDGTRLATSHDGDLRLWSLPDLGIIQSWNLYSLGAWDISCALAFAPDGQRLIAAGWDGVLRRLVLGDRRNSAFPT